jgi:hypothetical protein
MIIRKLKNCFLIILFGSFGIYFYNNGSSPISKIKENYANISNIKDYKEKILPTKSLIINDSEFGQIRSAIPINFLITTTAKTDSSLFKITTYFEIKSTVTSQKKSEEKIIFNAKKILLMNKNEILQKTLHSLRIKYEILNKVDLNLNEFSIIIYEDYDDYLKSKEDSNFQNYLTENKIGIIVFNSRTDLVQYEITECYLSDDKFLNEFLFVTKYNRQRVKLNKKVYLAKNFRQYFESKEKFISILNCEKSNNEIENILTVGKIDNIDYAFINSATLDDVWLLKSLFIDSIRYLSRHNINFSLKRYVLVDIDDVFVTKIKENDFNEMIKLQNTLTKKYFYHDNNSFKLNLGMSGYFYSQNNTGDRLLIGINFK